MAARKRKTNQKLMLVRIRKNGTMINPLTNRKVTWSKISDNARFIHEK